MLALHHPRPTFIPIYNDFTGINEKYLEHDLNPVAIILAHAAQILLFTSLSGSKDLRLCPDPGAF